jgi:acyl-CoA dehydrogenase
MIPRTVYSEEHEMFRDAFRKFLEVEVAPYHEQWEEDGQVSREVWLKAGAQGFLGPSVPEKFGGLGLDFGYNCIISEEVCYGGYSGLALALHSDLVLPYLCDYGSTQLVEKYMPRLLSGEFISAIAITEPGAGSDVKSLRTTAIREGDHYVLNGSKTYITNGALADVAIVVAKTDPEAGAKGVSLLFVETGSPGFEKGKKLKKLGMKAQDTGELFFNNVKVPVENLIGEEGKGFGYLMRNLSQERLTCSVSAVSGARRALDETLKFVRDRIVFGEALSSFQNTQFKVAEMDAEITQAQVFVDRCIELFIQGKLDGATAAKAKMLTTDMQGRIVDAALQLHGGAGYMWEYPISRLFADARIMRIFAGSNEVMKMIISREILK